MKRQSVPHHDVGGYTPHVKRIYAQPKNIVPSREAPAFKPYKVPRAMLEVFKRIDANKRHISPNA